MADFGRETVPGLGVDIQCNGTERGLSDCSGLVRNGVQECQQVAGVICQGLYALLVLYVLHKVLKVPVDAHHAAHCVSNGRDPCTECSGPSVCPVNDICYCSSECFDTGLCCPDVRHLLSCLGKNKLPLNKPQQQQQNVYLLCR